jgi:hypothetical protein
MTPPPSNDSQARRAQIRRRRIGALAGAVALVVLLVVVVGAFAGWFSSSSGKNDAPAALTTPTTPTTAKSIPASTPPTIDTSASWPTFGNTPENTRSDTAINSTLPLRTVWSADTGRLIELPPVVGGGRVVVGNYGYGVAIDLSTGKILW